MQAGSAVVAGPPITISLWWYCTNDTNDQELGGIYDNSGGAGADALRMEYNASSGFPFTFATRHGGTETFSNFATRATLNSWNFMAGSITSGNTQQYYMNSITSATQAGTAGVTGLVRTTIGAYNFGSGGGPGNFLAGRLADIGVWNAVLTLSEINSLRNGAKPSQIRPRNLVVDSPMNEMGGVAANYGIFRGRNFAPQASTGPRPSIEDAPGLRWVAPSLRFPMWALAPAAAGAAQVMNSVRRMYLTR